MTLYEQIISMDIKEMAEFFYELLHAEDMKFMEYFKNNNISASLIEVDKDIQIAMNIKLLKSERNK